MFSPFATPLADYYISDVSKPLKTRIEQRFLFYAFNKSHDPGVVTSVKIHFTDYLSDGYHKCFPVDLHRFIEI